MLKQKIFSYRFKRSIVVARRFASKLSMSVRRFAPKLPMSVRQFAPKLWMGVCQFAPKLWLGVCQFTSKLWVMVCRFTPELWVIVCQFTSKLWTIVCQFASKLRVIACRFKSLIMGSEQWRVIVRRFASKLCMIVCQSASKLRMIVCQFASKLMGAKQWSLAQKSSDIQALSTVAGLEGWLKPKILTYRFRSLMAGAVVGIVFCCLLVVPLLGVDSSLTSAIALLALVLPVFTLLWFFRTHDIKTQIEKSEKQINQTTYFKALENLDSKDLFKIVIGVRQLIELRKLTQEYNSSIAIVFEKFLQLREELDQGKVPAPGKALNQGRLLNQGIDYTQIDFSGIYLKNARLKKAKLQALKLTGADLSCARLDRAYLSVATLEKTNLSDTNFSGAENLESATFEGAFYYKDMKPEGIDFTQLGYDLADDETKDGKPIVRICKKPKTPAQKTA